MITIFYTNSKINIQKKYFFEFGISIALAPLKTVNIPFSYHETKNTIMQKKLLAIVVLLFTLTHLSAQNTPVLQLDVEKGKSVRTLLKLNADVSAQKGTDILRNHLPMTADEEMRLQSAEQDNLGFTHQKHQQYYKGIKVDGSTYTVHSKPGSETILTGNYRSVTKVDTKPVLDGEQALALAQNYVGADLYAWETTGVLVESDFPRPKPELVIVADMSNEKPSQLAWKIDMNASYPLYSADLYVHAQTGEIIQEYNRICLANAVGSAATRYSGTQTVNTDSYNGSFRLRDYSRGNGVFSYDASYATTTSGNVPSASYDYTDNNNDWTAAEYNNARKDNAALDAHFAAQATYDFFSSNFGRNSYDNNGAIIKSYVNCDIEQAYGYPTGYNDNAFWNGIAMVYGKGRSYDPLTTVDITAHEIGHAVCQHTCNLVYSYESGAMNESLSDIWGTCVEHYTNTNHGTNKNLWLLGSEIGTTFRSMSNPNAHGQPDTYLGTSWYSGSGDNGGVHYNSGVGNFWFYILTVGKSGVNDNGDSYNVSAIGIDKAAAITWRSEAVYLSTNSQYADWRTYAIQSAVDLYGSGSAEEQAVTNAWYAVGIGSAYNGGGGNTDTQAPSQPSVTASNITNTTATLSWPASTDNVGVTGYDIMYNGNSIGTTTSTSVNISGMSACTTYTLGIVAYDAAGNRSNTGYVTYTTTGCATDTQAPSTPTNLSFSSITQTSAVATWSVSSDNVGVTGYDVYLNGSFIGTATNNFYSFSGLTASTTYTVYVRAKDAAGNVSGFATGSFTTLSNVDTQAPSTPTNLSFSSITQTSAVASWNASSDNVGVTGYDVYLNGSFTGSTTSTSYSFSGLTTSTTYTVYVRAKDAAGNVSGFATGSFTTLSNVDTQPPSQPSVTASNITNSTATLSWPASTDNVGVTGYDIMYNGNSLGTTTGTSINISGMAACTTYTFGIVAFDAAGNRSATGTVTLTTTGCTDTQAPSTPTNLTFSNITQTSAVASWTASTDNVGVVGYNIYLNGSFYAASISPTWTFNGLTPNTTYNVSVQAKDAAGNFSAFTSGSFTTLGSTQQLIGSYFETGMDGWLDGGSDCYRYYNSTYAFEGNYSIRLRDNSGTASAMTTASSYNLTGYNQVEIKLFFYANSMENGEDFWVRYYNGSTWQTVAAYASGSSFSNNLFYVATIYLNSSYYNFPTNAKFRIQCDASSNADQVYIDQVTITASNVNTFLSQEPINTLEELGGPNRGKGSAPININVYPNPTSDFLTLNGSTSINDIQIFGIDGALILQSENIDDFGRINVSQLSPGTYFIMINTEEGIVRKRFVKL